MRRSLIIGSLVVLFLASLGPVVAAGDSWTGEVLDMDCYKGKEMHGEKHAQCAKTCLGKGAPMGLLTEDGSVVLLVADESNMEPYNELKDLGGETVKVTGKAMEKDGETTVTVKTAKKAM